MDNQDVARLLGEIGDLLEIKGGNPFKIRAYRNAAEVIGTLSEPASALSPDDLLELPGIGRETPARTVGQAAIVGAGTMGTGIATCFANAGIPVRLTDSDSEAFERALAAIRSDYERRVERGRLGESVAGSLFGRGQRAGRDRGIPAGRA